MDGVADGFLLIRFDGNAELDGLRILLVKLSDLAVMSSCSAVEMFDHAYFHRRVLLPVADLDLERLVNHLVAGVTWKFVCLRSPTRSKDHQSSRGWSRCAACGQCVFTNELQLAVRIAAVKTQLARRQRDAKVVRLGVHEFALDDDFLVA